MKKNIKWILLAILLAAIIIGAFVMYNKFKDDLSDDKIIVEEKDKNTEDAKETAPLAPDFLVFDSEGNGVRLSDFRGKPVVVNFWATWCYYCKEEMPTFDAIAKKYPDVQFLMINATDGVQETEAVAQKYIDDNGYTFDVFFDTRMDAVTKYNVTGLPATYFIDREGRIVGGVGGMLDEATLERGIGMIN